MGRFKESFCGSLFGECRIEGFAKSGKPQEMAENQWPSCNGNG